MYPIEKIDDVHDTNFNAVDMKRKIREISLKINEIIDVVNALTAEYDEVNDQEIDDISKINVK